MLSKIHSYRLLFQRFCPLGGRLNERRSNVVKRLDYRCVLKFYKSVYASPITKVPMKQSDVSMPPYQMFARMKIIMFYLECQVSSLSFYNKCHLIFISCISQDKQNELYVQSKQDGGEVFFAPHHEL